MFDVNYLLMGIEWSEVKGVFVTEILGVKNFQETHLKMKIAFNFAANETRSVSTF